MVLLAAMVGVTPPPLATVTGDAETTPAVVGRRTTPDRNAAKRR